MCNWITSKGKICRKKSLGNTIGNTNYCGMHSKKILGEIKKAQCESEEKSRYARELYEKYNASLKN